MTLCWKNRRTFAVFNMKLLQRDQYSVVADRLYGLVVWLRSKHAALLSVSREDILSEQEGNNASLPSKDNFAPFLSKVGTLTD